jgi:hypothetical protein
VCVFFACSVRSVCPSNLIPIHPLTIITCGQQQVSHYTAHLPPQLNRNRMKIKTLLLADGRTLLTAVWRNNRRRHGEGLGHIMKGAVRICATDIDQWRIPIPMSGHAERVALLPSIVVGSSSSNNNSNNNLKCKYEHTHTHFYYQQKRGNFKTCTTYICVN